MMLCVVASVYLCNNPSYRLIFLFLSSAKRTHFEFFVILLCFLASLTEGSSRTALAGGMRNIKTTQLCI